MFTTLLQTVFEHNERVLWNAIRVFAVNLKISLLLSIYFEEIVSKSV